MDKRAAGSAALLVLMQEIRVDREALEVHAAVLRDAVAGKPWPEHSPTLSVVAVAVHHYYGAAESIFERVARAFEGPPERSDRWHQDLLERMTLPLEDVRPAVLRRETARALAPVLGFRHFFRHASAVSFDPRRLEVAAEDVQGAHALLCGDLDALEKTLIAAARRVGDDAQANPRARFFVSTRRYQAYRRPNDVRRRNGFASLRESDADSPSS